MFRSAGFQKPFKLSVDLSKIIKEPEGTAKSILPKQVTWNNSTKPTKPPQAKALRSHGASIPGSKDKRPARSVSEFTALRSHRRFWINASGAPVTLLW